MKLSVFFSWEMETDCQGFNNKKFLIRCINKALNALQGKGKLKNVVFEFQEGLSGIGGAADVADIMMQRVKDCDIFIGDMTIVQRLGKFAKCEMEHNRTFVRLTPNANVLMEYAVALNKNDDFWKQSVILMNTVNGDVHENENLIPFDVKKRRFPITFTYTGKDDIEKAEKNLVETLKEALRLAALDAIDYAKRRYAPFITYAEQQLLKKYDGRFEWTQELEDFKNILIGEAKLIRVVGLSGMGKTRLLQESFKKDEKQKELYLYIDALKNSENDVCKAAQKVFEEFKNAIVVVDNCQLPLLSSLMELRKAYQSTGKLITINNEPSEPRIDELVYVDLKEKQQEVVVRIRARIPNMTDAEKVSFENFVGGNPMIAELLAQELKKGGSLKGIGSKEIMNKLLGCDENSDERMILRALALFNVLRYDENEETHEEIEFIGKNKNILPSSIPDDAIVVKISEVIKRQTERGIIERGGNLIGVRPQAVAVSLFAEWLEHCNPGRMKTVIKAINDNPLAKALGLALCDQIKMIGEHDKSKELFKKMLDVNGFFENIATLNTDFGARFMESMAEACPNEACECLYRIYGTASLQEIEAVVDTRISLVQTLSKLCFFKPTFEKAASIMLKFAVTEPEYLPSGANGDFNRLFYPLLGATETDLTTRAVFLSENVQVVEYRRQIIRALECTMRIEGVAYLSGAEVLGTRRLRHYSPKYPEEVETYIANSLDFLDGLMADNDAELGIILENHVTELCLHGFADLVLPRLIKIAKTRVEPWESLLDTLILFKDKLAVSLSDEQENMYKELVSLLSKSDFAFRFRRIDSDVNKGDFRIPAEVKMQEVEKKYEAIAEEFVCNKLYTKELMAQLYASQCITVRPFGKVLAEKMSEDERAVFIKDSVDILNGREHLQYDIIVDFAAALNNAEFDKLFDELAKLEDKRILFAIVARRSHKFNNPYTDRLIQMVEKGEASVDCFINFWFNYGFMYMEDNDMAEWLGRVGRLENGKAAVLHILQSMTMGTIGNDKPKTIAMAVDLVMDYDVDLQGLMRHYQYWNVVRALLGTGSYPQMAQKVHGIILKYLTSVDDLAINNYEINETYRLLLGMYFDEIWPELSKALLSDGDDVWTYFKLKDILGSMIGGAYNEIGLLFVFDNTEALLEWCRQNPAKAPARLIDMAPVFGEDGAFSPLVTSIVNEFGEQPNVLEALDHNMSCFGWYGSVIPLYSKQINALEPFTKDSRLLVKTWAEKRTRLLESEIEREKKKEQEFEFRHGL